MCQEQDSGDPEAESRKGIVPGSFWGRDQGHRSWPPQSVHRPHTPLVILKTSGPSAPGLPLLSYFLPVSQEDEAAPPSYPGCPHSLPATPLSCSLAPMQLLRSSSIEAGHRTL